jgi:hypothetical protein
MTSEIKDDKNRDDRVANDAQFSPEDLTDGRPKPGDWKTRYPDKQSQSQIRKESLYLIFLLVICSILIFLILCDVFQRPFGFSESQSSTFNQYLGIFLSGMIGGILFDLKWLIHSVGKGRWNEDRKLWRYFTPITSGILSVFVMLVISSGLFGLFNTSLVDNLPLAFSLAFLSGYFSDYMEGRLQEVFGNIFGHSTQSDKQKPIP